MLLMPIGLQINSVILNNTEHYTESVLSGVVYFYSVLPSAAIGLRVNRAIVEGCGALCLLRYHLPLNTRNRYTPSLYSRSIFYMRCYRRRM